MDVEVGRNRLNISPRRLDSALPYSEPEATPSSVSSKDLLGLLRLEGGLVGTPVMLWSPAIVDSGGVGGSSEDEALDSVLPAVVGTELDVEGEGD